MQRCTFSVILVLILLSACNPGLAAQPAATQTIISTITPTSTLAPTKSPTITPTPTIEPPPFMNEFLTDVKILAYDNFDFGKNWSLDTETTSINNGVLEMQGRSFWASSVNPTERLIGGKGILLKFKLLKANGQSEFVVNTGDWQTDGFRQFGLYNGEGPVADIWQGKRQLRGISIFRGLKLQPDTWYNLLLAVGKNGQFIEVIWDPNDENQRIILNETFGENWIDKRWFFMPKANENETVYMDDFYNFSFEEIK